VSQPEEERLAVMLVPDMRIFLALRRRSRQQHCEGGTVIPQQKHNEDNKET
jgi:hypothetical protein